MIVLWISYDQNTLSIRTKFVSFCALCAGTMLVHCHTICWVRLAFVVFVKIETGLAFLTHSTAAFSLNVIFITMCINIGPTYAVIPWFSNWILNTQVWWVKMISFVALNTNSIVIVAFAVWVNISRANSRASAAFSVNRLTISRVAWQTFSGIFIPSFAEITDFKTLACFMAHVITVWTNLTFSVSIELMTVRICPTSNHIVRLDSYGQYH